MAGLPSMLVPFLSSGGTSLVFRSGRLHSDVSNGRSRSGRSNSGFVVFIPLPVALDEPISKSIPRQRLIVTAIGGYQPPESDS